MRWSLLLTSLVGLALWAAAARADEREYASGAISPFASPPPRVPLEALDPAMREKVRSVLDKPTLSSRSLPETFNTDHGMYRYLLEHPDPARQVFRRRRPGREQFRQGLAVDQLHHEERPPVR